MDFSSTSVVITGAGKGIGRATAIMMAEQGADVAALSRTRSDLDRLKEETGCRTIAVDIADPRGGAGGHGQNMQPSGQLRGHQRTGKRVRHDR